MAPFHDLTMESIAGDDVPLSDYEGTVCLVVNVATECGLTPQYEGLQALHAANEGEGFSVLGFPCNQFGGQEPGSNEQINEFACTRYDVSFPLFAKVEVNGDGASPLYDHLRSEQPGDGDSSDITWNFEKFLVDREGHVVRRFEPMTTPEEIGEILPEYL